MEHPARRGMRSSLAVSAAISAVLVAVLLAVCVPAASASALFKKDADLYEGAMFYFSVFARLCRLAPIEAASLLGLVRQLCTAV